MALSGKSPIAAHWVIIVCCLLLQIFPAVMQELSPDYSIQLIQNSFTDDNRETIVKFDVLNQGGAADTPATATLNLISTGEAIAAATVPPLAANGRYTVVLQFSNTRFGPNSVESFRAAVGIDEIETSGSQTIQDNFARILIMFPANLPQPVVTPEAESTAEAPPAPQSAWDTLLQSLPFNVDTSNPEQIAVLAGIGVALLLLVAIVIWLLRLVFVRKPDVGGWQPSYANLPLADPNSLVGRHQQWQAVAQNNQLPADSVEGTVVVRKLLTGVNEQYLSGWHAVAFQISQYDKYGRISRSQVVSSTGLIRRLEWVLRRAERLLPEQKARHLRPIAQALSRQVRKKVNERTGVLPLVMDIRLKARHGEVHIWFELYRRQYGQWVRIDRWEPEMMVTGKMIYENFTYTLYGLKPGENLKQFQKRLEDDLVVVWSEFFNPMQPAIPQRPDAPTDPHLKPVP